MKTKNDIINMVYDTIDCSQCYNWIVCANYFAYQIYGTACVMAMTAADMIERGLY